MADLNNLTGVITSIAALSVVTERFVEIIKGMIPPLNAPFENKTWECFRVTALRLLAVIGGVATVSLSHTEIGGVIDDIWNKHQLGPVALGLLASGGSGFWNAVLKYVGAVKDLRKSEVSAKKEA